MAEGISTEKVIAYFDEVKNKANTTGEVISCSEVSGGRCNQVFRIITDNRSYIFKYSPSSLYKYPEIKVQSQRNRYEAESLLFLSRILPHNIPVIYYYDEDNNFMLMQDLYPANTLANELIQGRTFKNFSKHIIFILQQLSRKDSRLFHLKYNLTKGIPELQKARVEYVFKAPIGISKSVFFQQPIVHTKKWINKYIIGNQDIIKAVSKLEIKYKNNLEVFIHGDLHAESIIVDNESTYIIDLEFGKLGPMGFDHGVMLAHLVMAFYSADYHVQLNNKIEYKHWIKDTIMNTFAACKTICADASRLEEYKYNIRGYCAVEILHRTTSGVAVVDFFSKIKSAQDRSNVEVKCLNFATDLLLSKVCFNDIGAINLRRDK